VSSAALDNFASDMRYAVRGLWRSPLFTAVALLTLAILYGVGALDQLTYAGVALALTAAAVLASWLPARRAASVDPAEALAAE